jgi:minichromosome maintenance protein 10
MTDTLDTSDIDAQIAALQAQKATKLAKAEKTRKELEKEEARVLIGLTPTKTATKGIFPLPHPLYILMRMIERAEKERHLSELPKRPVQPKFQAKEPKRPVVVQKLPSLPQAGSSKFSSSLASIRRGSVQGFDTKDVRTRARSRSGSLEVDVSRRRDGEDLTVVEDLKIGPREFGRDPEGEDVWDFLEPNSGIRLT